MIMRNGYPISVTHHGTAGQVYTLYASSHAERMQWVDAIQVTVNHENRRRQRYKVVDLFPVDEPRMQDILQHNEVKCSLFHGRLE